MSQVRSFPPIVGPRPRTLVLGSAPGVASLQAGEYYAHPRNAFWPIMGELCGAGPGLPYRRRAAALKRSGVALWDVLQACERAGSLDSAIERASEVANDIGGLLRRRTSIGLVLLNGGKAEQAFRRHVLPVLDTRVVERVTLRRAPSTSPAHAVRSFDEKLKEWREAMSPHVRT